MYKIYISMQCAPDSDEFFQSIFGLRALSKCVLEDTFGHGVKSTQISHLQPVCTSDVHLFYRHLLDTFKYA